MKKRVIFVLLGLLFWGVAQVATASEAVWIDVRTAEEFASGHVTSAINIPHEQIADGIKSLELAYDQPIYLYCRSGRRSGIAQETLQGLGYLQVVNVGGLEDAQRIIDGEVNSADQE